MTLTEQQHKIRLAIGLRIKAKRIELGISRRLLCDRTGIPFTKLPRVECGEAPINTDQLYAIAHYLNVPIEYFFEAASSIQLTATDFDDADQVGEVVTNNTNAVSPDVY